MFRKRSFFVNVAAPSELKFWLLVSMNELQGIPKRSAPGCVKKGEKVAFYLPTAGRRVQLLHLIFTQPGAHLLEFPCTTPPTTIW